MANIFKILSLFTALFFLSFTGMAQDVDGVEVTKKSYQSNENFQQDKDQCYANADDQFNHTKHKTAKNTGAGVAGGAVLGKIFGKPGVGAVIGGAGGAYRGHKKSKSDQTEFNNAYASCLRTKGYDVQVEDN